MSDLITLDEYKALKGILKGDQDEVLSTLIKNSSAIIQNYIGRGFTSDEDDVIEEYISLDYDTREIYLEEYPVRELVAITALNPMLYDSTVHYPVSNATYILDPKKGKLLRTDRYFWPQGPGAIKVTYKAGASTADEIPPELKQATVDLVTYYHKEEYKDSKQMRGASINNNTGSGNLNSPSTSFPPHIQRVLDLFK